MAVPANGFTLTQVNTELGTSGQSLITCIANAGQTGTWDSLLDFANYSYETIGGGLKFDAVNDYINHGNPVGLSALSLNSLSSVYTVSVIFSTREPTIRQVLVNYDNSTADNNRVIDLHILNATQIRATQVSGGNGYIATIPFTATTNVVYHLVFVKDTFVTNWRWYINGVVKTQTIVQNTNTTIGTPNELKIGSYYSPHDYWRGTIWDVSIFNRALSAAEALTLYNNKSTILPSGCVFNTKFDDGSGVTSTENINASNGLLTNFTNTTPGASNAWVDENGNPIL